ncbi:MAG: prenyltransferase [Planctomycetota bacterium]|nr:MAG: prenyltransferase [Planctomycetota bacterium]
MPPRHSACSVQARLLCGAGGAFPLVAGFGRRGGNGEEVQGRADSMVAARRMKRDACDGGSPVHTGTTVFGRRTTGAFGAVARQFGLLCGLGAMMSQLVVGDGGWATTVAAQDDATEVSSKSASDAQAGAKVRMRPSQPVRRDYYTPETARAVRRGLTWLYSRQQRDGSFSIAGKTGRNVAVVSLAGMAWLSEGSTPQGGRFAPAVRRATEYVLAACKPNGYINVKDAESHGPMYGHGFATLFLAEVYGMTERQDVRDKLQRAVRLIVNSQNREGGWRYHAEPRDADVSVTVCQIMALRAARNAGLYVPKQTVDRCVEYVKRCQNADGGFRYMLNSRPESRFPRTAAAVVALYSSGVYDDEAIARALRYMLRFRPPGRFAGAFTSHLYYGHYYAVQAMWQAGGSYWDAWYPNVRDELLARQSVAGYWRDPTVSNEYATAMACIVLQMPESYLPIFQR